MDLLEVKLVLSDGKAKILEYCSLVTGVGASGFFSLKTSMHVSS